MILTDRRHKVEVEKTVKNISISRKDIEDMIIESVSESYGIAITRDEIRFKVSWKYAYDEWGMNKVTVTVFGGAEVEVQDETL